MLYEILLYLNNWFCVGIYEDTYTVQDGCMELTFLQEGQYFRITGSIFNDGVYQYGSAELHDETFAGAVWALAIPQSLLSLVNEIAAWQTKYGDLGAYASESITGNYSYSLATGSNGTALSWKDKFAARLTPFRKLGNPNGAYSGHQDPSYRRPFNPEFPWG